MSLPTLGAGPSGGGGGAAPFVGFLDSVSNVEHVYLLFRGLSSYSGPLVRLRRDSDDAESDFGTGADGEFLDVAAITTWLGGSTGYVVTIYDQTANGDDITQATKANQPALTLSDAAANNKPTMSFDGGDWLQGAFAVGGSISQPNTIYTVTKSDHTGGSSLFMYDGDDASNRHALYQDSVWKSYAGTTLSGGTDDTDWNIWTALYNGASSQFWDSGVSEASGNCNSLSLDGFTLGAVYTTANNWQGDIAGAIIIDGNSSDADKNTIGQKFDTVYGITYTDI